MFFFPVISIFRYDHILLVVVSNIFESSPGKIGEMIPNLTSIKNKHDDFR